MRIAGVPPERTVILGQSLGTAVASAVALRFADPGGELLSVSPSDVETRPLLYDHNNAVPSPTTFAGTILVAPFSSLPSLMLTYRIGGFFPILLPFRPFPRLAGMVTSQMVDKWPTADRLAAYYTLLSDNPKMPQGTSGRNMGTLQIIHAINDHDIDYHQTEMICRRILGESEKCVDGRFGAEVLDVKRGGKPRVRFEILEHGGESNVYSFCCVMDVLADSNNAGHNRIVTYSPVAVAVVRAFEDLFD